MIQHSAVRLCFINYFKEPGVVTDMLNNIRVAISQRKTNSLSIINVSSDCLSYCWQGALSDQVSPQNKLTKNNSLSHG